MTRLRSVVRDLALVCLAVAVGWWGRDAGKPVLAQRSSSSSSARNSSSGTDSGLAFQINGTGPEASLAVYNPANRTLYVYQRIGAGNSQINCDHSFRVTNPGAPIQRENCPVGDLVP